MLPNLEFSKKNLELLFDKPFTMALLGSTKAGKTTFLSYIIPKIAPMYDLVLMFSNSINSNVYDEIKELKNCVSYDKFHPELVEEFYSVNKKWKKVADDQIKILVVLDDEINKKNDKTLKNLFAVMRNSNFATIFSGQDWSFINKANRNNLNYVYIFKQNSMMAYEEIHKIFLKGILKDLLKDKITKSTSKFKQNEMEIDFIREATANYNILVIDVLNDYTLYTFRTPN